MNHRVLEGVKEFILGGNANFIIHQESVNGKKPVTFKYKVKMNDNGSCWFVYTEDSEAINLTEDGKDLKYRGYLRRDLSFNVGAKGSTEFCKKAINGLLWVLKHADNLPEAVHIYHHGRCSKCGRKLTDIDSLRCGLGPTCRKKVGSMG